MTRRGDFKVREQDIKHLRTRFQRYARDLEADRNNWRAHAHERRAGNPTIRRLPLRHIMKKLDWVSDITNDLRFVLTRGGVRAFPKHSPNGRQASKDIADLIFNVSIARLAINFGLDEGTYVNWNAWERRRKANISRARKQAPPTG